MDMLLADRGELRFDMTDVPSIGVLVEVSKGPWVGAVMIGSNLRRMLAAIRIAVAFLAGEMVAAAIMVTELDCEATMPPHLLLFGFFMALIAALGPTVFIAVPIWAMLRWRRVFALWIYGLVGAILGFSSYLVLVAIGIGAPSDHPLTF